ncbi:hypothetical protein [Arthrobacter sp. Alg241-R88]|uniref:hypothetical protein n=1 Tax=Arthrobacter sp. Alg241-R88 TaxID=2305984 RepID=UPI001F076587|nr:hypothetical protein [Arthrobacter sp. Alg241-R88]
MLAPDSSCPIAIRTTIPSLGPAARLQAGKCRAAASAVAFSVAVISGGEALNPRVIRARTTTPSTSQDTPSVMALLSSRESR